MSTNEHEHGMTTPEMTPEERMHALLCAVVLGEASGAERAEVDAALAQSAELRAERARIEATVGIVSGALRDGASELGGLSGEAKAALERAATKRARPVWHRSTALRIAASIVVLVLGAMAAYRAIHQVAERQRAAPGLDGETTASAPRGAADPLEKLKGLGYVGEGPVRRSRGAEAKAAEGDAKAELRADAPRAAMPESVEEQVELGVAKDEADAKEPQADSVPVPTAAPDPTALTDKLQLGYEVTGGRIEALDQLQGVPSRHFPDNPNVRGYGPDLYPPLYPGMSSFEGDASGVAPAQQPAAEAGATLRVLTTTTTPNPALEQSLNAAKSLAGAGGPATPGAAGPPARPSAATAGNPAARGRSGGGNYTGPGDTAGARKSGDDFYLGHGEKRAGEPPADAGNPFDRDEEVKKLREIGYAEDARRQLERERFDDGLRGRILRLQELHRTCLRWPNERPRDMFFRFWGDNPFEFPRLDALSTFSADVDTASYALARRYIVDGYLPQKEQVRTEEFVNYFKGDVPPPNEGVFRIATELAPSLFSDSPDAWMLRVAIRGREVAKSERQPLSLTFVVDVSGSMKEENRLDLVKHALRMLLGELDGRDSIAIVAFSTETRLVLPMTSAAHRSLIEAAIHPLHPEGSTNTEAGLRMGYEQAVAALARNATNRVVLLTDGVANVGITDPNALTDMVARQRQSGVYLNTVGVGMDNHNDNLLEQLADRGDGLCNYVDDAVEVRRALVDNFTGAFEPIARDLKIQVEFDPTQVDRYRLLGYENRAIADADFRNAKIDAAEIGAGHQVVALYEIVRRSGGDGPLATVRLRYKPPHLQGVANVESNEETEIARSVQPREAAGSFAAASAGYRRSVLVAQFAELLRRSIHARHDSLDRLIAEAQRLATELKDPEFDELVSLMIKSRELVLRAYPPPGWYERCCDEIRHRCYLEAQIEDMRQRLGRAEDLGELERGLRDVEERLRELELRAQSLTDADGEQLLRELQAGNIALQRALLDLASKPPSRSR